MIRLVSILAADVVGYSRMMHEDHARTLFELRRIRDELVEPSIVRHHGGVVKRLGDGWLASFDRAAEAVRCAAAIQDDMAAGSSMRLRIGVHVGHVTFEDEDIFGDGVNIAARLEALAAPGGVAISDAVWSGVDQALRRDFDDAGPRTLKNIAGPVRVWARGGLSAALEAPADGGLASIVVEPFATAGRDLEQVALAEGVCADLETELSRFRWLRVVSHAESAAEGRPRVRYVLGGAVRGAGSRWRVTAHLTSALDGRRLWSERFDRDAGDVFALQDELASTLVSHVCPVIDSHEKALARMRPVECLTAAELSLRTNEILSSGRIEAFEEAGALMARAVALEPHDAQAKVQASLVGYSRAMSGAWPARASLKNALEHAREAVRLDPRLANGYVMLSAIQGALGETDRSLDAAAQASTLNPNAWGAPHGRSIAYAFATPEWAAERDPHAARLLENAEATLRMAPSSAYRPGHLFYLGLGLMMRGGDGDLTDAIAALDRSAAAAGATWRPSLFAALAELRRGDADAAAARVGEARNALAGLSLTAVEGLFGASRIWRLWRPELALLADCGLPID